MHGIPKVSIAPMMDRTDRHFRAFLRQLTSTSLLYTEMVTTGAILHGDRDRHLKFSPQEHPIALQVGGDDPVALQTCAEVAEEWGYDEINLNVGCPSDRVQNGSFGACLMARPERVAEAVRSMKEVTEIPVTVKHRIGIDDLDKYEDMKRFVEVVAESGCTRFSVHARKAWLKGLSPKENRTVPPLRYEDVYRLKRDLPHLFVEINGGVRDLESIREHLNAVDAVMVGRAAYDNPWILARVDSSLYGETDPSETRADAVLGILNYAERICSEGIRLHALTRHLHHLFHGLRGSRQWKQHLSTVCTQPNAGPESLREGLCLVPEAHE